MPSASAISEQVARETERRRRLAVPAFAGGVLYLLSGIIVSASLSGAPTVGLIQALSPALRGEASPRVSPRAPEVKFISHHALPLVAGSVIGAIAVIALTLVLLVIFDATRFRRPETWSAARPLIIVGGIGVALLNLAHSVTLAITSHKFAVGHDLTSHAVDRALLTSGTLGVGLGIAGLFAAFALAVGMGATMVASMRVGLTARWVSILGIFAALFFLPFFASTTLELVTAFWLVAMGILFIGKWPNGDPPAWAAGEARPWPSGAEMRAAKRGEAATPAPATATADVAPAPAQPAGARSSRRRKRGARR
jgi:MFS family permease